VEQHGAIAAAGEAQCDPGRGFGSRFLLVEKAHGMKVFLDSLVHGQFSTRRGFAAASGRSLAW
jgi:hypothetical protein